MYRWTLSIPRSGLAFMLKDAAPAIVLTHKAAKERLHEALGQTEDRQSTPSANQRHQLLCLILKPMSAIGQSSLPPIQIPQSSALPPSISPTSSTPQAPPDSQKA